MRERRPRGRATHARPALPLFLVVSLLSSCAPSTEIYRDIDRLTAGDDYLEAIEVVRSNAGLYDGAGSVLYNMDLGALYHYAGMYDSSNARLFEAERIIDSLYTKSISLNIVAFIANDNLLPYEGEDFEKVFINVFLALNYAAMGMEDDALVEARKVDLKLRDYSARYEGKNTYREDAFIRYLAGVLYENGGEINDALVSYKKSHEAYGTYLLNYNTPAPDFLLHDLVRTAGVVGISEDVEHYTALGGTPAQADEAGWGGILLVVYSGPAPIKIEEKAQLAIPDQTGTTHTFTMALPKFVRRDSTDRRFDVFLRTEGDTATARCALAEDLNAIALKDLEDRLSMVYLKSGGRALLKFLASEALKEELNKDEGDTGGNFLRSLLVDVAVSATESADVRSWRTLPSSVHLLRVRVPPGDYEISVSPSDRPDDVQSRRISVPPRKTSIEILNYLR